MKRLEGKVALITGGGTGVGRAIGLAFAEEGASVAVNYSRSQKEAEETAEEIKKTGVSSLAIKADVSRDNEVRQMVKRTVDELGRLDILVNSAGWTSFVEHKDLEGLTEEIWDRNLAVNLKGVFYCSRAVVEPMKRTGGGCIINITSIAGIDGTGSSIAYCASKAGAISVTKSMGLALAPDIIVNSIAPGVIDDTRWTVGQDEFKEVRKRDTPMARIVTTKDIAELALYIATSSHFITGQTIILDGGKTIF